MSVLKSSLSLILVTLLVACGSTSEDTEKANSGFLSNYEKLKETNSTDKNISMSWRSDKLTSSNYSSVTLDNIAFFPTPKASKNVSMDVIDEVVKYTNTQLKKAAEATGKLVPSPEKNTLQLQFAITQVEISDKGLSGIQYLPIAFIASAVSGNLDNLAPHLTIEGKLIDAESGELVGIFVNTATGEDVVDDSVPLTLEMAKPIIDNWAMEVKKGIRVLLK